MKNLYKHDLSRSLLLALAILLGIIYFYSTLPIGGYYNNDDLRIEAAAVLNEQTGKWIFKDSLNEKYDTYGFVPRGYLINSDKILFPMGFIGSKLIFMPLFLFLKDYSVNIFQTIICVFDVLLIYLIGTIIFPRKWAILLAFLFGISAFFFAEVNMFFPDMTNLFFLLATTLSLLRFTESVKWKWFILLVLFFSLSLLVKFPNVLFLPPILLWMNLRIKVSKRRKMILNGLIILLTFLGFAPQLWFNYTTTGRPFEFMYTSYTNPYSRQLIAESMERSREIQNYKSPFLYRVIYEFLFPLDGGKRYVRKMVLMTKLLPLSSFIFIFLPVGLIYFFRNKIKRSFLLLVLLVFGFYFYVFGNIWGAWGSGLLNLRSSFMRYMFFPFTLLFIVASGGAFWVFEITQGRYLRMVLVILLILVLISGNNPTIYPFSMYISTPISESIKVRLHNIGHFVLNETEPNSIIFTGGFDDGFLIGKRKTFNYGFIPNKYQKCEINKVISSLLDDGYPVFVYRFKSHSPVWGANHLFEFCKIENITIKQHKLPHSCYELFRIEKKREQLFSTDRRN